MKEENNHVASIDAISVMLNFQNGKPLEIGDIVYQDGAT